jgi:hypothetical protein
MAHLGALLFDRRFLVILLFIAKWHITKPNGKGTGIA